MPDYFDKDSLKELKEETRLFLKLDIGYLAALFATITAYKLSAYKLSLAASDLSFLLIAFAFVAAFDAFSYLTILNDWGSASISSAKRKPATRILGLINLQLIIHTLFILILVSFFMAFAIGYKHGVLNAQGEIEGRVLVQESIEDYISHFGRPPVSITELKSYTPDFDNRIAKLQGEEVSYIPTKDNDYLIIFGGWDKKIGTHDDVKVSHALQLRPLFEKIKNKED